MLQTIAIRGYRSLRELIVPLAPLTVVTGANGTGKSSLYRALMLLADCGRGDVIGSLAREGGLQSVLWAGPEQTAGARRTGKTEPTVRTRSVSLEFGFASDDFGYLVDLGLPQYAGPDSMFARDPEIKREVVFAGPRLRPSATLVRRRADHAEVSDGSGRGFAELTRALPTYQSVLTEHAGALPEIAAVRERLRSWRFYDGFRVDADAPARQPRVGTRTVVMADDGGDVAAAIQTILEVGHAGLTDAVADAFDGATVSVLDNDGLFELQLHQTGMLRPLRAAELSDGTLRFLLWGAALFSPRPPSLMVLNEPETSLHPDLIAPLAEMIRAAAAVTQIVVVTHSATMREVLSGADTLTLELVKEWGESQIAGQTLLSTPAWDWGKR